MTLIPHSVCHACALTTPLLHFTILQSRLATISTCTPHLHSLFSSRQQQTALLKILTRTPNPTLWHPLVCRMPHSSVHGSGTRAYTSRLVTTQNTTLAPQYPIRETPHASRGCELTRLVVAQNTTLAPHYPNHHAPRVHVSLSYTALRSLSPLP